MKQMTHAFSSHFQTSSVIFAVTALLVLVQATSIFSILQAFITPMTVPISERTMRVAGSIAMMFAPLQQQQALAKKVQWLSQQLAETEGKNAQLEQLRSENAELRVLLENRHLQVKPRRLARPVVSSLVPLVWMGEDSDVQPGWLVLYKDTVLGVIADIDGQYARVSLLSASEHNSLLVQTSSGARGVTTARNGKVTVTNITPEAIVTVGDRVVTVGQQGVAPGKFVGIVTEVEQDPEEAHQTIVIDQLVSFYQTSVVEIEE